MFTMLEGASYQPSMGVEGVSLDDSNWFRERETLLTNSVGFFTVDRRAWARACGLGLDAALAYLVVSRGTLGDMRTTSWSAKSVKQRTDIPWRKAKAGVQALVAAGLLRRDRGGQHPRYHVMPAHQVRGCEGWMPPDPESQWERDLLDGLRMLPAGKCLRLAPNNRDRFWANQLVSAGLAQQNGNEFTAKQHDAETAAKPDWIWLPVELVDGAVDETAPVELVRQSDNIGALRLLVDLYHAQSLSEYGGVHWRQIRTAHKRYKLAERGAFVIWGFTAEADGPAVYHDAPFVQSHIRVTDDDGKPDLSGFWSAYKPLRDLGLIEIVSHLVTSDSSSGTVIHALPLWATGEAGEREISAAAIKAAAAMLTKDQRQTVVDRSMQMIVPVRRHIANVQLVGLVRLRYRAKTRATSMWFNPAAWTEVVKCFEKVEAGAQATTGTDVDINGLSKEHQRPVNGRSTSR